MYNTPRYASLWLGMTLILSACSGTPEAPPPAPEPAPVVAPDPGPQPFENEVISVPVSPVETLPSDW